MNPVQAERDRMNRALFECLLLENARLIAGADPAGRRRGLAVVMDAYDQAVRTRRRRPVAADIRAEAELALMHANAVNQYSDEETAARRAVIGAEADSPGLNFHRARLTSGSGEGEADAA
jgi:hypothetical protein